MHVEIRVDSVSHRIDTRDQETLARWLIELFDSVEWNPATWVQVQVYPSFDPRTQRPDWIADSRILGDLAPVNSPQEFIDHLQAQYDRLKALHHG